MNKKDSFDNVVDKIKNLLDVVSSIKLAEDSPYQKEDLLALINELAEENKENFTKAHFYIATIDALPNPIFVKNAAAQYVFLNKKYSEDFGIEKSYGIGKTVLEVSHLPEEDKLIYQQQDLDIIENSSVLHYEHDFVLSDNRLHRALYWSKGFVVPETNERGLVGEIVDISTEKELERELASTVLQLKNADTARKTDFTTGIGNRYELYCSWDKLVPKVNEEKIPISFIIADLDSFKNVNDTYGHGIGDEVIKQFSKIFSDACGKDDICVRYGGEEFLAVLTNVNIDAAKIVAKKICDTLRNKKILPDGKTVTVSLGITEYILGEELHDSIDRADKALYVIKNSGKDGFEIL